MSQLAQLFGAIFDAWNTPITLTWIGETSPFKLTIYIAALGWIGGLVAHLISGGDD